MYIDVDIDYTGIFLLAKFKDGNFDVNWLLLSLIIMGATVEMTGYH